LAVEDDVERPSRGRDERDLRDLLFKRRQQFLRGPSGSQEPAAAGAVVDFDAGPGHGGLRLAFAK
jgi:hypothetical protein